MFHNIYGTTIYIGKKYLETKYGNYIAYTYQDLINKGYIIACVFGDLKTDVLYTRLHSSCVTSETLRSMDCDCVKQLNGAFKKISEKGNGILFYLIQEGRGCGYVGKSRACMLVQYNDDKINTFDAYKLLGMKMDYRTYQNVYEICYMLNILDKKYILLTNNPDKINSFKNIGLNLINVESIEIKPTPFNAEYLLSKKESGHILYQTKEKISKYHLEYQKIPSFTPHSLNEAKRFIYVASYYLPIKPINNEIILDFPLNDNSYRINENKYLVQLNENNLKNKEYTDVPYWFKVNVYYDIVSYNDYILLEYGNETKCKIPIVRIHSESIFNRFPLNDRKYKKRYKISINHIIKNDCGYIILLYNDGKGSGLGYYILNSENNINIGLDEDKRDYDGAILLLKNHSKSEIFDILAGDSSNSIIKNKFEKHGLKINNIISFDDYGYDSLRIRLNNLKSDINNSFNIAIDSFNININNCIVTGIGSSEAHAKYFQYLFNIYINGKCHFSNVGDKILESSDIILFSQGLSPNINLILDNKNCKYVIMGNKIKEERKYMLNKIKNKIIFASDEPDDTLLRITGPLVGYITIIKCIEFLSNINISQNLLERYSNTFDIYKKYNYSTIIDDIYLNKNLYIIVPSKCKNLMTNIYYKFIEGCNINPIITSELDFSHGTYQNLMTSDKASIIYFFDKHKDEILNMIPLKVHIFQLNIIDEFSIIDLEIFFTFLIIDFIIKKHINQKNWSGINKQYIMYNKNYSI